MLFKEFLSVMEFDDSAVVELNKLLEAELDKPFNSPENGILVVRKVLQYVSQNVLTPYETDPEGDEVVLDLQNGLQLYLLYAPNDEGYYEFYAEAGDEERMEELLSEGGKEK